ncbi:hypothetical protein BGZ61DRAFT_484178 [Ilyonectria robusta]|uniref:uncharacterized protein n=1 Tax=Ilyonectria robusta TaxID=1079257 RepID=UPI001E8E1189|nr:uncharacterized protein BGZ61DRAFT_484178 [Ilyonectria robusta]KAH8666245.1 hypothetical protein BGZ61DRAFT_484178 [Ilyonectria robusta]
MTIHARGVVSVVEVIVYIPALVAAFIVCSRHSFNRASGWVFTIVLCVVRVVGGICQLLTYSNHSSGLIQATIIIDSIGISPLLLATLGMLSRFVDWISARGHPTFTVKQFRLVQLLITIGLILSIAGGTSGSVSPDGSVKISSISKVGIILYIIAFAAMAFALVVSSGSRSSVPLQERRVPVVVAIAFPLILVRLVYSAICLFLPSHLFSIIDGSVPVFVCMAVLEEFAVVAMYLGLGFNLKKLDPSEQGELSTRPWKAKKNRKHGRSQRPDGQREGQHGEQWEGQGQYYPPAHVNGA